MPRDQHSPPSLWSSLSMAGASALALAAASLLSACGGPAISTSKGNTPQQLRAMAMWQERCKKSGEFIHKTVENVEGVYVMNVRMSTNFGESKQDQFALDDPYGHDVTGEGYVRSFLRNSIGIESERRVGNGYPIRYGYQFVEAVSPTDGKLYRYTGHVEEPWQHDKSYLKGHRLFVTDKSPLDARTARYGVKFDDISTHEEREYWIAGSSLKVIDLQTQEVIAERIGYMVDWAQGSRAGGRSPWLFAAGHACPSFKRDLPPGMRSSGNDSGAQAGQTLRFVQKVLKPNL